MMEHKKILLVGFGPLEEKLTVLLAPYGWEIQTVQPSQMNQTIGELCRYGENIAQEPPMERGTVLFWNFSQQELDPALKVLREAGIPRQPHKAMVTPTNWHWKLSALLQELAQEQLVMGELIKLKKLRDQMPVPAFTDIPAMRARMQAEMLLKGGEDATAENIRRAYEELAKFAK